MAQLNPQISPQPKPQIPLTPEKAEVIKAGEHLKRIIPGNLMIYKELTPATCKSMAMFSVLASPGQDTGSKVLRHAGDETMLVISGNFQIEFDDRKEKLGPGDSVYIPRGTKHRVINTGGTKGEAVFTLSPPEY